MHYFSVSKLSRFLQFYKVTKNSGVTELALEAKKTIDFATAASQTDSVLTV
jgi:hypothetical protein